jgi:hypothetical protein
MSRIADAPHHPVTFQIPSPARHAAWFVLVALMGSAFVPLVYLLPSQFVLPAYSVVAVAAAAVLALVAWLTRAPRRAGHVTTWDLAGGCAFGGIAAAMLSRPEQVLGLAELVFGF